ncbi:DUF4124 domain-containing protein [Psychrobacter arenosus]|uniref:DUF4124 domain-containing protein n=1 Tax=Psychrobacter arenosus TaxID=256326 RepID=UPI0019198861|nr:DUF4124 domain-containing protein [Psychrobacter arenosus]
MMKSLTNLSANLTLAFSVLALTAVTGQAASIYKVVDKDTGRITFTDRPDSYQQDNNKQVSDTHIATARPGAATSGTNATAYSATSTNTNAGQSLNVQNNTPPALITKAVASSTSATYRLAMTTPASSQAYRRPAQTIDIQLAVSPALKAADKIAIYLDGNEVAQGTTAQLPTIDMLPGEHQISGKISNEQGVDIAEVQQTIYILQNNLVLQQKKLKEQQLIEQLKAYEKLSWPQKLYLQMQQQHLPQAALPKLHKDKSSDEIKDAASQAIGGHGSAVQAPVKTSSAFK